MNRLAILSLILLAACTPEKPKAPPPPPPVVEPEPQFEATDGFVTEVSGLRRQATTEAKVPGPSGTETRNWITTLHRGETLRVVDEQDDWYKVLASDETEGWVRKRDILLQKDDLKLATVYEEAKTFIRPDLLAGSRRTIEPGSLLFVVGTKDQFSEVNVGGTTTAWIMTDKLTEDDSDIAVSKLVGKARWLVSRKEDGAEELMTLANEQFSGSKLLQKLTEEESLPSLDDDAKTETE